MPARPRPFALLRAAAPLVTLACAGCALTPAPRHVQLLPVVTGGADAPWWTGCDDPLLAGLIAHAAAAPATDAPDAAGPADAAAAAIALAYLDARRAQQHVALRSDAVAGLRDNAEIAGFRREAGLVSAVDTGLAGVLVGLNDNAVMAARADRDAAVARLAALTGMDAAALAAQIAAAPVPRVWDAAPDAAPDAPPDALIARRGDLRALADRLAAGLARHRVTQAQIDAALADADAPAPASPARSNPATVAVASLREAEARARAGIATAAAGLTVARARLVTATATANAAESAASDARLGYRAGKEAIAALYVAEAAALAAREGLADAGIAVDSALVRLWTAQGRGATAAAPAVP